MYIDHYGLNGQPFQLTPDARFWFESRTHRKAMAYLGYGLAQGEGSSSSPARSAPASRPWSPI
jgi:type II secretory pathway predicted ATPase ExeA